MKNVDLAPMKQNDEEYYALYEQLSAKFKCDWDDSIHDSYAVYVEKTKGRSETIRQIRCKAETLEEEMLMLKADEMIKYGESLCKEADLL